MKQITTELRNKFIVEMLYGHKSISRIAHNLKLTHEELAQLLNEPEIQHIIRTLARFVETYANMLLFRQRLSAITRLGGLIRQRQDNELSRKACVDLIKLSPTSLVDQTILTQNNTESTPPTDNPQWVSDETLQSFLSEIGGLDHESTITQPE